ncbi:MAG: hypothetical protein MHMPM18_001984 [Marteilia pararefringens]
MYCVFDYEGNAVEINECNVFRANEEELIHGRKYKFIYDNGIKEGILIGSGSKNNCKSMIDILSRSHTINEPGKDDCMNCISRQMKIDGLQSALDEQKNEIKLLQEKLKFHRRLGEKYLAAKEFFLNQNKEDKEFQAEFLADSTEQMVLDRKYPTIKIQKYQYDILKNKSRYGEAVRYLIDILLERDLIVRKNATTLRDNFPEEVDAITRYTMNNFNCSRAQINKSITDKCHS